MFTSIVNAPFINNAFSAATIHCMPSAEHHPSYARLLEAARKATAHLQLRKRVTDDRSLRAALQITSQTAYNWKQRGVSQEGALQAERCFGISATSLLEGHGAAKPLAHPPSGGLSFHPVDQEMIHPEPEDDSLQKPWELLVSVPVSELPKRFRVAVPDGALASVTPKGTVFSFVSPPPPDPPGESVVVFVQTGNGRRYIRLFFALGNGAWEARSRDGAFPSFHSERDELQLLAVAIARVGGEG